MVAPWMPGRTSLKSWSSQSVTRASAIPMSLRPRDHRVPQHPDVFYFCLDHVARLQIEGRGVLTEPRHAGDGPRGDDVARPVAHRRVVADDLRDRHRHAA